MDQRSCLKTVLVWDGKERRVFFRKVGVCVWYYYVVMLMFKENVCEGAFDAVR